MTEREIDHERDGYRRTRSPVIHGKSAASSLSAIGKDPGDQQSLSFSGLFSLCSQMTLGLRLVFSAVTVAVIMMYAYYLIEMDAIQRSKMVIEVGKEAQGPTRKDVHKSVRRAVDDRCVEVDTDLSVWESYLDKKTKRKLRELLSECDKLDERQVQR